MATGSALRFSPSIPLRTLRGGTMSMLSPQQKGRAPLMDTTPKVGTESRLEGELGRLKSRLAQGQRDHQRSHDELQRLESDIRNTEHELRTYRRENVLSAHTESELAGARDTPLRIRAPRHDRATGEGGCARPAGMTSTVRVMLSLYLLRHAKSSWSDPALPDHERPLSPRGRRDAKRIADHLLELGIEPALVLCSTAARTRETLELVRPALGAAVVKLEAMRSTPHPPRRCSNACARCPTRWPR